MAEDPPPDIDARLAVRERPVDSPVMFQSWGKLLFLHWPIDPAVLRPLIPDGLAIDTREGRAWVALTPFTMWGVRPPFLPALAWISRFHELNVRTYVHRDGIPGVWFFSLDAERLLPVLGARALFHLPYHHASMSLVERDGTIDYRSRRRSGRRPAELRIVWRPGDRLPQAEPGSLEFFLVERYCLYSARAGRIFRCRIAHVPWPLRGARLQSLHSTMMEAAGFRTPDGPPTLHAGGPVDVTIGPLERA